MIAKPYIKYKGKGEVELRNAIADMSYYGNGIFIKEPKYKEVDAIFFQPVELSSSEYNRGVVTDNQSLWNTPMIFVEFEDINGSNIY